MYADPQSVTINAVPVSLPRTGASLTEGSFQSADSTTGLAVTHRRTNKGRVQHRVGLRKDVIVPSIYNPAQNTPQSYSVALVIDGPTVGIASVDIAYIARALVAWATNANLDKLVAAEI
jgi:hypothetical protein